MRVGDKFRIELIKLGKVRIMGNFRIDYRFLVFRKFEGMVVLLLWLVNLVGERGFRKEFFFYLGMLSVRY